MDIEVHALTVRSSTITNVITSDVVVTNVFTGDTSVSKGIWDTGATNSVITQSLARKLNLQPISRVITNGVHGPKEVNVYYIRLTLNNEKVSVNMKATECSELSGDSSIGLLIGMDLIALGDFAITNYQGKTVMSFRIPSIQCIDFVQGMRHSQPVVSDKLPGRNDPCPCGSGKKYKHCCGKNK